METFEGVDAGTDMTPPIKAKQQMKATKAAKRRDEADIERLMESSYEWKTSSRGRASPALYERDGATDALVDAALVRGVLPHRLVGSRRHPLRARHARPSPSCSAISPVRRRSASGSIPNRCE